MAPSSFARVQLAFQDGYGQRQFLNTPRTRGVG